jgi:hypothetical protein
VRYGVQCRTCGASIPAIRPKSQDAIRAWNRRLSLARLGGKATRGLRSGRKLAAALCNLKKGQSQVRQVNKLRQGAEAAFTELAPYREREWIGAQVAESPGVEGCPCSDGRSLIGSTAPDWLPEQF